MCQNGKASRVLRDILLSSLLLVGQMVCTSDVIAVIAAKNVKLYDFYVVEKSPVENGYSTHSSGSNGERKFGYLFFRYLPMDLR